jgi:hypothetical protein
MTRHHRAVINDDRQAGPPNLNEIDASNPGRSLTSTDVLFGRYRVRTCRRELLDRTLIHNQRHLLHALREFETHYNAHRPHQGIANARPLTPLPKPIADPNRLARLHIHRRDRLGGILHEYQHAA